MSFDLRCALDDTFDVTVPQVPMAAIRERGSRATARASTQWKVLVAAIALTSAFTLTLAYERHAPPRASVPIVSTTPAPIVT